MSMDQTVADKLSLNRYIAHCQHHEPSINWRSIAGSLGGKLVQLGWDFNAAPVAAGLALAKKSDSCYRDFMANASWAALCDKHDATVVAGLVLSLLQRFEAEEARWLNERSSMPRSYYTLSELKQDWHHRTGEARALAWVELQHLYFLHPTAPVEWLATLVKFETD